MRYVDPTTPGVALNFFGAGKGGFQDGDPTAGVRGTLFMADLMNDLLGNLMQLLTRGGVAPTPGRYDDVPDAIAALVAAASGFAPGDFKMTSRTTADPGWVMASGRTIGDATSGATERANPDTAALFAHNWETFDNARLPIQTSAGAASARGPSAAADFAAHKRLPLLDASDYVFIGRGNMSGAPAGRITAALNGLDTTVLGAVGGVEGVGLTGAQNGPHTHKGSGPSGSNSDSVGGPVQGTGTPTDTTSSGLGDLHPNVQPGLVVNVFVKL